MIIPLLLALARTLNAPQWHLALSFSCIITIIISPWHHIKLFPDNFVCFLADFPNFCLLSPQRSPDFNRNQHLHQVFQPGHGVLPADGLTGDPGLCGRVLRLVLRPGLALLLPGGGHRPAAAARSQDRSHEGKVRVWRRHRHVVR